MTVQIDVGAPEGALTCQTCHGAGEIHYKSCEHYGACPCGLYSTDVCPECEGSGKVGCDHCGEPAYAIMPKPWAPQPVCFTHYMRHMEP